jgi:hypothetical protein
MRVQVDEPSPQVSQGSARIPAVKSLSNTLLLVDLLHLGSDIGARLYNTYTLELSSPHTRIDTTSSLEHLDRTDTTSVQCRTPSLHLYSLPSRL